MDRHKLAHSATPVEDSSSPAEPSRRRFMQGTLASAAALGSLGAASLAHAQTELKRSTINHYHLHSDVAPAKVWESTSVPGQWPYRERSPAIFWKCVFWM
jgi:hypothetical protein